MSVFQTSTGDLKFATVILSDTSATTIVAATVVTGALLVEYVRAALTSSSTTTTLVLDVYNGTTAYQLRGAKALAAHEVHTDRDAVLLEPGSSLRATRGAGDNIHCTALYFTLKAR